jgi:MFS family permease
MLALALASSLVASLIGVTLLVLGMALLRPAVTSMVSQAAGPARQGAVMGANQSIQSLADIVAPLAGGALIVAGAPGAPFLAAALIALAGLPLLRLVRPVPAITVAVAESPAVTSG